MHPYLNRYADPKELVGDALAYITMHPEQHRQHVWIEEHPVCGTVGCLAGWMAKLDGQVLSNEFSDSHLIVKGKEMTISAWARQVLGIDGDVAVELFSATNDLADLEAGVKAYMNGEPDEKISLAIMTSAMMRED